MPYLHLKADKKKTCAVKFVHFLFVKCSMGNCINLCLFHDDWRVCKQSQQYFIWWIRVVTGEKKLKYNCTFIIINVYWQETLEYSVKTVYIIWEIKSKSFKITVLYLFTHTVGGSRSSTDCTVACFWAHYWLSDQTNTHSRFETTFKYLPLRVLASDPFR